MGFIKNLVIGAAVVAGINYITKKRPDGTSLVDDIKEKAPDWINKAKDFGEQKRNQYTKSSSPTTMDNY